MGSIPRTGAGRGMRRVTADRACPVCEKPVWCLVAADGTAAICSRVEAGSRKHCGDAGWLHRLAGPVEPPPPDPARPPGPPTDWAAEADRYARRFAAERRAALAAALSLPADAFDPLPGIGFRSDDPGGPCWTFPEVDAAGAVIGLLRRFVTPLPDGTNKRAMRGGRRGLSVPAGWRDRPGPVLVVEGPTDALALTAAGLAAVGRPAAAGGGKLLAGLLADLPADRPVIVVGENDRKDDGSWPGRAGAESVGRALAAKLGRPVRVALPPAGAKDVRDWLAHPDRVGAGWADRGAALLAHLTAASADPPATPAGLDPDGPPADAATNPHRLAAGFLAAQPGRLRYWRGEFHRYAAGAYRPVPDADLKAELTQWLREEFVRQWRQSLAAWREKGEDGKSPVVRPVNGGLTGNVLQALCGLCLLPAAVEPPAWVDGAAGPDPAAVVAFPNGLLDLAAAAAGRPGCLLPPDPLFFTTDARPFPFDPAAPPPRGWLRFLAEVWPDDPDSVGTLQEWFGYCLAADTRQQKIMMMIGPPRSGKGTAVRILRDLIGPANVAGPTLASLSTNFGLWPLLGRALAVVSDARLGGRSDAAVIVERLLSVSGEDALTVDRKNREPVTAKLSARLMIVSNELPRLGDASGALPGRLLALAFARSFVGREDPGLFDRLRAELPGILLWALEGWRRLRGRGRFVQPASGAELLAEVEDLGSPVGAFVRDRCVSGPDARVITDDLYQEWRSWCDARGRREPGTAETFGRDIRAAVPGLRRTRPREDGGRVWYYTGVRLRLPSDPDPDDDPGGPGGHGDRAPHGPAAEPAAAAPAASSSDPAGGHGGRPHRRPGPARRFRSDDRPHAERGR